MSRDERASIALDEATSSALDAHEFGVAALGIEVVVTTRDDAPSHATNYMGGIGDVLEDKSGLGTSGLPARLPDALQRLANERLHNDAPRLDQVRDWSSPVALRADHFR